MKRRTSPCIAPFVVAVVPVALAVYSGSDNGSNGSGGGSSSSRSSSSSSSGRRFVSAHCAASLHGRLRAMLRFRHSFQRVAL